MVALKPGRHMNQGGNGSAPFERCINKIMFGVSESADLGLQVDIFLNAEQAWARLKAI
jgi:hypothetical protein